MHIKSPFIVIVPLAIPSIFSAPIYKDSRQDLTARGFTQLVPSSAMPNSGLTPLALASGNKPRVAAFPSIAESRLNNLKLTTQFSLGFQKSSTGLLIPGGGAPCPLMPKGRGGSSVCRASSSSDRDYSVGIGHGGTEVSLHPEGHGGLNTKTIKKLTVGHYIGYGNRAAVFSVPKHEFGDADLAIKIFHDRDGASTIEKSNLRKLGQLHASGKCNGHDCIVMNRAKGISLKDTDAYKNRRLDGGRALVNVFDKVRPLVGDTRFKHMHKHRLIHNFLTADHIKLELNAKGEPVKANLVGWRHAMIAPKRGPEEVYDTRLEKMIRDPEHLHPAFEFPPNRRIGSHPVLPPDPDWDPNHIKP